MQIYDVCKDECIFARNGLHWMIPGWEKRWCLVSEAITSSASTPVIAAREDNLCKLISKTFSASPFNKVCSGTDE